jgi:large subunit ribosomal protein L4
MLQVPVYNQEGEIVEQQELDSRIWGIKPKIGLIHEVLRAQMAKARPVLAHTKTRGEVRGGGKKPWPQKGTGRARHGSIRSPLWRGGGVIFGPTKERNYSLKVNKKVHRQAILMCLSDKVMGQNLIILDKLELKEKKTKELAKVLKNLTLAEKKVLLALSQDEKEIGKLGANIKQLGVIGATNLNVKDLLKYPILLTTKKGIEEIEKTFNPYRRS